MAIISPSLLACNFLELGKEIQSFEEYGEKVWLHLDIMDGLFVPNLTFGHPVIESISKAAKNKMDAHLMVKHPAFFIETFKNFSIHNITFHHEATPHHDRFIHQAKEFYPSVGISLNPSTPITVLPDYLLQMVDLILIMSVNPGFGGQKFIPSALDKIRELERKRKVLKAKFQIQVDGGINGENAPSLIDCGADNLVVGSYLFKGGPSTYKSKIESMGNIRTRKG